MTTSALLVGLLCACHAMPGTFRWRTVADARGSNPIARGLSFLEHTQLTQTDEELGLLWAGGWPQRVDLVGARLTVPDVNAGLPAYVHHALTTIHEGTAATLGLSEDDVRRARAIRVRAAAHLERFAVSHPSGTPMYGWWPRARKDQDAAERLFGKVMEHRARGPNQYGILAPPNMRAHPKSLRIHVDLDDTAYVYATLLESARLDGRPAPPAGIEGLAAWRDVGDVRREFPTWLRRGSGAFLTWVDLPPDVPTANDVCLGVNANVLWALAVAGKQDTPGFDDAVAFVNRTVASGRLDRPAEVSLYYPQTYILHAVIARAYALGPIPALAPAAEWVADDIERNAMRRPDGSVSWGTRDQPLRTALAMIALAYAGRESDLMAGGARFLEQTQDPRTGGWPESTFVYGTTGRGETVHWKSQAVTTACAVMALAMAKLAP